MRRNGKNASDNFLYLKKRRIIKAICLLISSLCWINANAQLTPQAYFKQGEFQLAIEQWQTTLNTLDNPKRIDTLFKIGTAYQALGRHERAQTVLNQALCLAQEINDLRRLIQAHTLLSDTYRLTNRREEAQIHIESALDLVDFAYFPSVFAAALVQQGHLYLLDKKYVKALQNYQQALSLLKKEPLLKAKILLNITQLMYDTQSYGQDKEQKKQVYGGLDDSLVAVKRVDAFEKALQAVRNLPNHYQKALMLLHLSELAFQNQLNTTLQSEIYTILTAVNQLAETFPPKPRLSISSYANGYLGKLYQNAQRHQEAIQLTQKAIFLAQEISATDLLYRWERQLGQLWREQGQVEKAIQVYRLAVKHSVAIRPKLTKTYYGSYPPSNNLPFHQTAIGRTYFEMVELLLKKAQTETQASQQEKYFCEAREVIEISQQSELKDYLQDDCLRTTETTKPIGCEITFAESCSEQETTKFKHLAHNAAILYFFTAPDRERIEVLLYLANRGKTIHHTVLLKPEKQPDLKKTIGLFTADLSTQSPDRDQPVPFNAQQLYNLLIKPIEVELNSQIDTLFIMPDDLLRQIAFAALYDEKKQEFLVQKPYALVTVLTPKLENDLEQQTDQNIRILLGGVSQEILDSACIPVKPPALPCVEKELDTISQFYQAQDKQILKNADFTKEQFSQLTLKEKRPYHIVHIASHGKFKAIFKNSYILTYQDCLYMDDLEKLSRLNLYRATPLELLTLSACETTKGSDKAALGLAGVAIKTGAKSVLASLWSVNDQATCYLMTAFYDYLTQGLSKANALQRAQRDLLETPTLDNTKKSYWNHCFDCSGKRNSSENYQHPAYWAAFLLVGNITN
jgi:CHAT domain-containing protein